MERFPRDDKPLKIVAIDPGTDTLGVSVFSVDLVERTVSIDTSFTICATKIMRYAEHYKDIAEDKGDVIARLKVIRDTLIKVFNDHKPNMVASESPFMGMRVTAFKALTECVCTINEALNEYDERLAIEMISPTSAKKAVGVVKKGSTKDDVKDAVKRILDDPKDIYTYNGETPFEKLDEHSVDSIAVGIYMIEELLNLYDI